MVLQRTPQKAIMWGFGDPSTLTTLRINDKIYTAISHAEAANGQNESIWSVTLDPVSDEGPLANGKFASITLYDVLFGDVWICSELTLKLCKLENDLDFVINVIVKYFGDGILKSPKGFSGHFSKMTAVEFNFYRESALLFYQNLEVDQDQWINSK